MQAIARAAGFDAVPLAGIQAAVVLCCPVGRGLRTTRTERSTCVNTGKVSPQFWIGETGKLLRGDANAQLLALYLMTCPHSTMTGVFHCPILYMAHETGMGLEGYQRPLQGSLKWGFVSMTRL